ncbi:hypothetical protein [Streptomyces sp. NPDC126499]|uniref:hypothetical protein n=1 Tax=Streptomyces sp. NPDC126499 TaxID=3155314 RepID=UPI0033336CD3
MRTRGTRSTRITHRRRGLLWRTTVAAAVAGSVALVGLPSFGDEAQAAPKSGQKCKDLFKDVVGDVADDLPFDDGYVRPEADWDTYDYDNPRHSFDGLSLPADPAERERFLKKIGTDYKKYPEDSPERVYARFYNNQVNGKQPASSFTDWLMDDYIGLEGDRARGKQYHRKVVQDLGLLGDDWLCEEPIEYIDKNGNKRYRKYDFVNYRLGIFGEVKSGPNHDGSQRPADRIILQQDKYKKFTLYAVHGDKPSRETGTAWKNLNKEVGGTDTDKRVKVIQHRATGKPRYELTKYTDRAKWQAGPGAAGAVGGAVDEIRRSPENPRQLAERLARLRANDPSGLRGRGLGGVDFSTLELRYIGKPVKGKGIEYAYSAAAADEEDGVGWGGRAKAQLISDSFFTWMALTPEKFWVNLNPDQPDKIMDPLFGKTDAGRVLLEADLQMKHDYARNMDPREGVGKLYWDAMTAAGVPCGHGLRVWIVPRPAQVRAEEEGLYILDAPLEVKSEPLEVEFPDPNGECALTEAQRKTSQRLVNELVVPDIERQVNADPEYADLRRVYKARVAAEYVRQQDAAKATDYRSLINGNDVKAWPLRAPHQDWTPRKTWDAYMKSYTEGDYTYPCEMNGEQKTCVMGGVDFSKAPKQQVSKARFTSEHRHLPRTTRTSVKALTPDAENHSLMAMGASGDVKSTTPKPVPTPSPSDDGTPSPQPSTPTPTASPEPTRSGGVRPTTAPQDPGGDLADTGNGMPVGLIGGFAAALLALGAVLTWRMRRRRG